MSSPRIFGVALVTLSLVAGCGGGGGSDPAALSLSPSPMASFTSGSPSFTSGEAVGVELTPQAGQDPASQQAGSDPASPQAGQDPASPQAGQDPASPQTGQDTASPQDPVTGEIDGSPTDVVVPGGGEGVIVVPNLPAGPHTLTLHVRGQTITLNFDVTDLPLTGDARENLAALIAEALRLLDEHLATHPDDTAAAGLRAQLAAAQALLASLTDAQVQALYQQLVANGLPAADAPGACVAAAAQHEARMNAMLRTARLTAWLAAKHAAHKTDGTHVAVLLAQARMEESLRRLVTYTHAVMTKCNGNADLAQRLEQVRSARDRSAKAAAAALR